jgi:UDP-N-acetylmuramate dehydrogenase
MRALPVGKARGLYNRPMQLRQNVDLTAFNTFGLSARAAWYAEVHGPDDLQAARASGHALVVLGGGSNIVLAGDLDALVLRMLTKGVQVERETSSHVWVRAAAGEVWNDLVQWTLAQGLGGLENLSLIPGTVGAAPVQNIGAYGVELENVFESLEAFDLDTGAMRSFNHADCRFAYRDSVFKHEARRHVIVSVCLRLARDWRPVLGYRELADELQARGQHAPTPRAVSEAVIAIRTRKLPDWRTLGNAGSFFQNPVVDAARYAALKAEHPDLPAHVQADGRYKLAAGWLIDRAGWKGRTLGHAGVYEKQALVLVNRGGATGREVLALAQAIVDTVREQFGVSLEREPVVLGAS